MDTRKVAVTIPINQIPFVMRAIGFYPSEQEVCIYNLYMYVCMYVCIFNHTD